MAAWLVQLEMQVKITTHPLDRRPNKKCSSDNGGDAGVYVIYVRVCKSPKSARETRERERESKKGGQQWERESSCADHLLLKLSL